MDSNDVLLLLRNALTLIEGLENKVKCLESFNTELNNKIQDLNNKIDYLEDEIIRIMHSQTN